MNAISIPPPRKRSNTFCVSSRGMCPRKENWKTERQKKREGLLGWLSKSLSHNYNLLTTPNKLLLFASSKLFTQRQDTTSRTYTNMFVFVCLSAGWKSRTLRLIYTTPFGSDVQTNNYTKLDIPPFPSSSAAAGAIATMFFVHCGCMSKYKDSS